MKLPAHAGASRKRNTVLIVPLDPAYKVGLAGHLPVKGSATKQSLLFLLIKSKGDCGKKSLHGGAGDL